MRAVTQNHIEQNERNLSVGRLLKKAFVAQTVIDHRMRPATGEHIVTQIDDCVFLALPMVGQREIGQEGRR